MTPSDDTLLSEGYVDLERLGSGRFGAVYSAFDTRRGRQVAIKMLNPLQTEMDRKRFERETRALGSLFEHPNIVTLFHSDITSRNEPYLVMQLATGGSLDAWIKAHGPMSWNETIDLGLSMARALGFAHESGVLHRDVKPLNIVLEAGRPLLADFGIAKLIDATASTRSPGGTLSYAAPEVDESESHSEQSDLYSLAATMYELLSGRAPFGAGSSNEIKKRKQRPLARLDSFVIPAELDEFVRRCLSWNRKRRPPNANAFIAELDDLRLELLGERSSPVGGQPASDGATLQAPTARPADRPPGFDHSADTLPVEHTEGLARDLERPPASVVPTVPIGVVVLIVLLVAVVGAVVVPRLGDNGSDVIAVEGAPAAPGDGDPDNTLSETASGDCVDPYDSFAWPATTKGPVVECPASPFGVPRRPITPQGTGWLVVLESIGISDIELVDERLEALERLAGPLQLFDSRRHSGLRDPYWVISPGAFETREAASAYCTSRPELKPCYPSELDS